MWVDFDRKPQFSTFLILKQKRIWLNLHLLARVVLELKSFERFARSVGRGVDPVRKLHFSIFVTEIVE